MPATLDETRQLCHELLLAPAAVELTADELIAAARKGRKRALGLDQWDASSLLLLPRGFWESLSQLWAACLQSGAVPDVFRQVRVALLPKSEDAGGGYRPLSVASVVWRLLATAAGRKLRRWSREWADVALAGAVPGRSSASVHSALACDIRRARSERLPFAGFKADVRKCFDRVHPLQAIEVALRLGLPENLANVIRSFYQGQCRFVSWQAQFGRQPIVPQTSLMQGCPFSCTLLNSVMHLWCCSLAAVPDISRSVYLDDRAIWCVARDPVPSLLAAFQAGERVDRVFDLQLRPGKLQSFSSCPEVRAALEPRAQSLGVPVTSFKLLGVHYNVAGRSAKPKVEDITEKMRNRAKRVALVTKSLHHRRRLLRELVLSLVEWAGPFQEFYQKDINAWTAIVERALWGRGPAGGALPFPCLVCPVCLGSTGAPSGLRHGFCRCPL